MNLNHTPNTPAALEGLAPFNPAHEPVLRGYPEALRVDSAATRLSGLADSEVNVSANAAAFLILLVL